MVEGNPRYKTLTLELTKGEIGKFAREKISDLERFILSNLEGMLIHSEEGADLSQNNPRYNSIYLVGDAIVKINSAYGKKKYIDIDLISKKNPKELLNKFKEYLKK